MINELFQDINYPDAKFLPMMLEVLGCNEKDGSAVFFVHVVVTVVVAATATFIILLYHHVENLPTRACKGSIMPTTPIIQETQGTSLH